LFGRHNPEAKREIRECVREDARRQAFGPIGDDIVKGASEEGHGPIGHRMREAKSDCDPTEGEPGEGAERDRFEALCDQEAEKKSAPKDFLHQRDDRDEPEETQRNGNPVLRWEAGKNIGIETHQAGGKSEKLLGRDPNYEDKQRKPDGENRSAQGMELILAPVEDEERAAEQGLQRVNPKLG